MAGNSQLRSSWWMNNDVYEHFLDDLHPLHNTTLSFSTSKPSSRSILNLLLDLAAMYDKSFHSIVVKTDEIHHSNMHIVPPVRPLRFRCYRTCQLTNKKLIDPCVVKKISCWMNDVWTLTGWLAHHACLLERVLCIYQCSNVFDAILASAFAVLQRNTL
jgi:hypothetical protein